MRWLQVMEWAGAGTVATGVGMFDVRVGIIAAGMWLVWAAWTNDAPEVTKEAGDDDGNDL